MSTSLMVLLLSSLGVTIFIASYPYVKGKLIAETPFTSESLAVKVCTYLIFKGSDETYNAQNCNTGGIDYKDIKAATVINNAISASSAGSHIIIKEGRYAITSPIIVNKEITITGVGASGTAGGTILVNNQNNVLINVISPYVTIERLTVEGTGNIANKNDIGIKITGVNNIDIDNVFFLDHYNDLMFSGTVFYSTVRDVRWYSSTNDLVYSDNTSNINVHFINSIGLVHSANNGFNLQGIDSIIFDSVEISGNFSGTVLILDRYVGGGTEISNSMFENSANNHRSLWIKGTVNSPFKFTSISNSYFNGGNGTTREPAIQIDYAYDLSIHGGFISSMWRGININNVVTNMIIDGVIFEVSSSGLFTSTGATLDSLVMSHNIYHTFGDYLINLSLIGSSAITGKNIIEANNVERSRGFTFPVGAPLLIINNIGYNPRPASAIIIHGAPFKYTNNDGYPELITISGGVVSQIALRSTNTGLTGGAFLLQPGDSITVVYNIAPTIAKIPQ
jgi:hypothetical protein